LDGTLVDSYETDADLRYIGNSITRLGFRQYTALNLTGGTAITNLNLYSTTMIPEPGTCALLGLGCGIGLFLLAAKRKRQNT
jgi:hypothetical protein